MRRLLVFVVLLSIFTAHSCSKTATSIDSYDSELSSLSAWMQAYHPEAIPFSDSLRGYYVLSPAYQSTDTVEEGDWVNLSYIGKTLDGKYFKNFYKSLTYKLGTFKYSAHYIPLFAQVDSTYRGYINEGMYEALQMMSPGDSVTLWLSSEMAYGEMGSSFTEDGFHGDELSVAGYQPVQICMKFEEIIKDPIGREQAIVEQYARDVLKLATYDSIGDGLYMVKTYENPLGDTITEDTTVYMRYTGYFTDGFVFDTNYEEVNDANNLYCSEDLLSFQYEGTETTSSSFIESWDTAIPYLRKGEKATIISTSTWAYGSSGQMGDTTTIIYPYTPLVFDVHVLTDDEYDDETD